jgi:DNA-binding transcriptional ArsR family regulator
VRLSVRVGLCSESFNRIACYNVSMNVVSPTESTDISVATARYFRVLSDPTRLSIIDALAEGPASVAELVEMTGLPRSRVSNHLACLRWCRLVEDSRVGRQVVYRLTDPSVIKLIRSAQKSALERIELLASCTRIGPEWL